jgi:hypothetical protein
MAFAEVKGQLERHIDEEQDRWIWRNAHYNAYTHLPLSKTPLKFLFHRNVPSQGNQNTVNLSKFSYKKNYDSVKTIESSNAANYKSVVQLDPDEGKQLNLISIDTGMNGNPFQGNYFSFNKDHLEGKLMTVKTGKDVDSLKTKKLVLKPAKQEERSTKQDEL